MAEPFKQITTVDELDAAIERSRDETVILFNFDPYCPVSAFAFDELVEGPENISVIDVSRQRDVTRELAQRSGVRHESPQVIVLRDGHAIWSASHYDITTEAVERATHNGA